VFSTRWRRRETSLLFAALALAACATGPPAKPDIPGSVSPGWKLTSLEGSGAGDPACWAAKYSGEGSADVRICWYQATASAFDATQRTRAEAQTVKFQAEHYFVLVKWNDAARANLAALVRALEKALNAKN